MSAGRIDLGTLAEQDVAAMASDITGQVPTAEELRLLTRRSGGIPLLVEELLAAGDSGVPVHLRALFLHRVDQLGPEATAIVQTSAVVGAACDDELLGAVSGSSLDRTRELVDAGCRQDILVRGAGGVALRHELLREVVYDALSSDTRRRLHHRVALELEARGETRAAKLAHHWRGAGQPERSGPASLAAAAEADAVHAPAAAHQHLERVLETWKHLPASVHEAAGGRDEVLRRAAQAAERAGSFRLSWALLRSRSGRQEAGRLLFDARTTAARLRARPLEAAIDRLAATARLPLARTGLADGAARLGLSPRELEVLPLLVAGRTNAEIADILVISPRTVGVHVSQILRKRGAARRGEAADLARRLGLVPA
jgi:DNA-binding CsgD family transcriptional regulator/predicted ATPase